MDSRVHPLSPAPLTPLQVSTTRSIHSSPFNSPRSTTTPGRAMMMMMMDEEYSPSMSRSPSISSDRSVFSPEPSSPAFASEQHHYMTSSNRGHSSVSSSASTSMSSLSSSLTSNNSSSNSLATCLLPSSSSTSSSSNPQLLLCPVCSRAFKPSKNQNCNLRRHLKNVHNMSPTMHPRKCKWDSLPDGRVKDDKDRKERTRKSKRLWARKFRLRRKVEEAAVVLSMLSQAV
ncbi:hypothetical protein BX616_006413 [Lobosporangium transversale]|nr:hypothetical protein BX616_006413 [Lobosporangium transversale]